MKLNEITARLNKKLADEMFTYQDIVYLLDHAVDDINDELFSSFPVFSDLETGADEYTAFPDKYIRQVVIPGAAYYFYTEDEEGEQVAGQFYVSFKEGIFRMSRDYLEQVPEEYQNNEGGYIEIDEDAGWL
jgi:hypothetical protein